MAVPFPEAEFEVIIYILLGAFMSLSVAAGIYIRKLHRVIEEVKDSSKPEEEEKLRTDNIGLSRRAEEVMDEVLKDPVLQSDLPQEIGVSKATVSNAVSELFERNLVKKKKKANTYLIEPRKEELRDQQKTPLPEQD